MPQDLSGLKKMLGEMLQKKQQDKANEDSLRQAKNDGDRNKILENIAGDLSKSLEPVLSSLAQNSKLSTDDIRKAFAEAIHIQMPDIKVPEIKIPAPIVNVPAPIVNIPRSEAPIVNVAPTPVTFPSEMSLKPNSKPFPVIMMDQAGKPMMFPQGSGGATGGKADFFTIVAMPASTGATLLDSSGIAYSGSNPLPITGNITTSAGATGQGDAASASRVVIAGNSDASVVVNSGTLTTVTTLTSITNSVASALVDSSGVQYSGSNPLPTTATLTLPSGQGDAATATRVVIAGNSDASVVVNSGTITTVTTLTGITNSVASSLVDSGGVQYSGSNPVPVTGTVTVSGITNTIGANIEDSSGVGYSGSNPFPITGTVAATKSGTWAIDNPVAQGDAATALRVVVAGNSDASVVVNSGTITTVTTLTGITNTVFVRLDSPDGAYSAANPLPTTATLTLPSGQGDAATATRVVIAGNSDASVVVNSGTITTVTTLTGITNSVASAIVDSGGVQYSTSNPVPINNVQWGATAVPSGLNETNSGVVRVVQMTDSNSSVNVTNASLAVTGTFFQTTQPVSLAGPVAQGDAASALRVVIAGNSDASVVVNSGTITTVTTLTGITNSVGTVLLDSGGVAYSGSNPVPTSATLSVPQGQGDAATAMRVVVAGNSDASVTSTAQGLNETTSGVLRVVQMSDTVSSVSVSSIAGPIAQGDAVSALRVIIAGNSDASVVVNSGTITTVTTLTGITNTVVTRLDTPDGIITGANPMPVTLANAGTTININNVGGGSDSMFISMARTTNPTAVADGADVRSMADKLGRTVTRPVQVRDLIATARANVITGTEATLIAAVSGVFLDMISVTAANASTNAVTVDFRDVSGAGVAFSMTVPASSTTGIVHAVPWPQQETNSRWTVDLSDDTHNITFNALFSKEL